MTTTTVREILAWDLRPGMRVRNGPDQAERRVVFVGSQPNKYGEHPVFYTDDNEPKWFKEFIKVEIVEVES